MMHVPLIEFEKEICNVFRDVIINTLSMSNMSAKNLRKHCIDVISKFNDPSIKSLPYDTKIATFAYVIRILREKKIINKHPYLLDTRQSIYSLNDRYLDNVSFGGF